MEAWEELAPELPPNWSIRLHLPASEEHNEPELVSAMDARGGEVYWGTREECERRAWDAFGITRKRYAELIAVELVREAAIEKHGESELGVGHTHGDGIHAFEVLRWGKVLARGIDYDLCDAAWACIQALGGGE